MNDFPNAPAPHSALFDNAPTVTVGTNDGDYDPLFRHGNGKAFCALRPPLTPATRIAQGRNGQWYALDVLMQYGAPVPLALALRRVGIGRTVFVAREDAGAVMEAVRGADGEGS